MSWSAAKAELADRLDGLAITAPIAQAIASVHAEPPTSLEPSELPAIVFGESTLEDQWGSSEATEDYLLTAYVALRDEDDQRAVQISERYRDALKVKLRLNQTLLTPEADGVSAIVSQGPSFSELGRIRLAGQTYSGFMFQLPISITGPATYDDEG